jgi:hypothetical protein
MMTATRPLSRRFLRSARTVATVRLVFAEKTTDIADLHGRGPVSANASTWAPHPALSRVFWLRW